MRCLLIIIILFTQVAVASSVLPAHVDSACNIPLTEKVKTVVDDELISSLKTNQLSWKKIKSTLAKHKIEKEAFIGRHDASLTYHIAKIAIDDNQLSYYLSEQKQWLICVSLSPTAAILPSFTLLKQPLSFFQRKYHFDETVEQLVIIDFESTNKITLTFNENVMTKFVFHANYLDSQMSRGSQQ